MKGTADRNERGVMEEMKANKGKGNDEERVKVRARGKKRGR